MAEKLTPLQKLDYVLNTLSNNQPLYRDSTEINKIVMTNQIDIFEMELILNKLNKDAMLESFEFKEQFGQKNKYRITFEGRIFSQNGGYQKKYLDESSQNTQATALQKEQKDFRRNTILLTVILSVGTTIAAVYYLVELYWKHHWFH